MTHPAAFGVMISAAAFLLFTLFDTATKFLAQDYSVFQIMAVEFATATVLLVLFGLLKGHTKAGAHPLSVRRPWLHVLRGICQILGQSLVFLALPSLSLPEFYVIIFCMPILTVLKGNWILKERPASFIWPVLVVNFAGVLIALRPDQSLNLAAFAALAGTIFFAASLILLRKMMETETPEMAAVSSSAALALAALAATPFVYKPAAAPDLALMICAGVLFAPAQIMLGTAFRLAPAALASTPQFLQLVYGAIAGSIVFGDFPGIWIYIGGAMVIAANIFMIVAHKAGGRAASAS